MENREEKISELKDTLLNNLQSFILNEWNKINWKKKNVFTKFYVCKSLLLNFKLPKKNSLSTQNRRSVIIVQKYKHSLNTSSAKGRGRITFLWISLNLLLSLPLRGTIVLWSFQRAIDYNWSLWNSSCQRSRCRCQMLCGWKKRYRKIYKVFNML